MKPTPAPAPSRQPKQLLAYIFAWVFGIFLGLSLLKFGTPAIFAGMVDPPEDAYQFVLNSLWPLSWGYRLVFVLTLFGLVAARWRPLRFPRWLIVTPLLWLFWQFVAASHTIDASLTRLTLPHMIVTVLCFYLGVFVLGQRENLRPLWFGLILGFALVLFVGLQQRFGGLEATRRYFYLYLYPTMKEVSPEYLKNSFDARICTLPFISECLQATQRILRFCGLDFRPGVLGLASTFRQALVDESDRVTWTH